MGFPASYNLRSRVTSPLGFVFFSNVFPFFLKIFLFIHSPHRSLNFHKYYDLLLSFFFFLKLKICSKYLILITWTPSGLTARYSKRESRLGASSINQFGYPRGRGPTKFTSVSFSPSSKQ